MNDFESFKAAREKMDPSSRGMSDHQWEQAYAAHLSSRQQASGGPGRASKSGRRGSSSQSGRLKPSNRGQHSPSSLSVSGQLRAVVRKQSAYADLRLIIDFLAWGAGGLVVLAAIFTLMYYTSVPAAIASIVESLLQLLGILVLRLLAQVFIDIPDIALFRVVNQSKAKQASQPSNQAEDAS